MMRTDNIKESGFTLIEVIMAIMISVIIISTMYSCLTQIMRVKILIDDEREVGMIANSLIDRLTRELQLVTDQERLLPPRNKIDTPYNQQVDLIGDESYITFIANDGGQYVHDGVTHSGAVQLTYRIAEDPELNHGGNVKTYTLVRDEVPYSNNFEAAYEKIMTFPVTSRIHSLKFAYFDAENQSWKNEWTEEERKLPSLIRFNLKIVSPSEDIKTFVTTVPIRGSHSHIKKKQKENIGE